MASQAIERPERGWGWIRAESTPQGLATVGLGVAALVVVVIGTIVTLGVYGGYTPVKDLVYGLTSVTLRSVLLAGAILGLLALIAGGAWFRHQPTKTSREQAISGAALGGQAVVLSALLYWFVNSDVFTFVDVYLDFKLLPPVFHLFVNGAKNTLILALTSEFLGVILGLFFAVFAISKRAVVRAPARLYINFFRGTPLAWQIVFIGLALPIGLGVDIPTFRAGIIAFSLNTGAYAAEVFRAGIQSIERGQLEAARGLGMSYMQAMRYAVIPQAVRRVIPPLMNEFVILIKDTALIILLGLAPFQRDLMVTGNILHENTFNATYLIATAAGYLIISLPLIRLVNTVEKRLRSGLVGVTG